jgi:plasmid stabilization system protein ParE
MTQHYTLSTQARQDLKEIKDYIARDSKVCSAIAFIE